MITIKFFASLREALDIDQLDLPDCGGTETVEQLQARLCTLGDQWRAALNSGRILAAVNQVMAKPDQPVNDGDEVAFFPPVTGG